MSVDRLLELVDGATQRRMFGGVGIYAEGKMLAVAYDGRLYLKVDGMRSGEHCTVPA